MILKLIARGEDVSPSIREDALMALAANRIQTKILTATLTSAILTGVPLKPY
jgi:hypothetical protein